MGVADWLSHGCTQQHGESLTHGTVAGDRCDRRAHWTVQGRRAQAGESHSAWRNGSHTTRNDAHLPRAQGSSGTHYWQSHKARYTARNCAH